MTKRKWPWILIMVLLLSCSIMAIKLHMKVNNVEELFTRAKNLEAQKKYQDALSYYLDAEKIIKSKSAQPPDTQASLFLKIGNLYYTLDKYDNAIQYYESAMEIWRKNYSDEIVQVYSNLATIYLEKNNFAGARNYYLLAIEEIEKRSISQRVGINHLALMHYYLADACIELNRLSDAEKYCLKALSIINNIPDLSELKRKIYHRLALICFFKDKRINKKNMSSRFYPLPRITFPAEEWDPLQITCF